MPALYSISYRDGRAEEHAGHRGYYYLVGADEIYSMLPDPAWCEHCHKITLCESLRSIEEVAQELNELETPGSAWYQKFNVAPRVEVVKSLRANAIKELKLLRQRRQPPRCLSCGQRKVKSFKVNEWAPHPGTGEEIYFTIAGMCSTNFAMRFFTIDGEDLSLPEAEKTRLLKLMDEGRAG